MCDNKRRVYDFVVDGAMKMYSRSISLSQEEVMPGFSAEFKIGLRSGIGFG